jgi:hypothetical protein
MKYGVWATLNVLKYLLHERRLSRFLDNESEVWRLVFFLLLLLWVREWMDAIGRMRLEMFRKEERDKKKDEGEERRSRADSIFYF